MQNFSKSILNYFATFNETRFRFNSKISQYWTDNELTLDFSVFQSFQEEVITSITNFNKLNIEITKGKYNVNLSKIAFKNLTKTLINEFVNHSQFKIVEEEMLNGSELKLDNEMKKEVYRKFNLQLRKHFNKALNNLQNQEKNKLLIDLGITVLPPSTLNVSYIEQQFFDSLQKIALDSKDEENFLSNIKHFLDTYEPDLVLFDLYTLLAGFWRYVSSNSVYLYIHSFQVEEVEMPILAIEVELTNLESRFVIRESRNLIYINTPGINSAKLNKILTTPRATTFSDLKGYVSQIELYFNGYYKNIESFILKSKFNKIVGENLPEIKSRIGLQISIKEDRRILDYSELITRLDSGTGERFQTLVSTYISGEVKNTAEEVNEEYIKEYPKNSYKSLISNIPLLLNKNQAKILTAAQNPKNKIIVVDGPPGTGKSYTITALVYLANLLNKSVLITSHKTQALDVVEEKLISQFRQIHPNSKPPILRLTKKNEKSLNDFDNTLSTQVVNNSINKSLEVKENIGIIEDEINLLKNTIKNDYDEYIDNNKDYESYIKTSNEFLKIQQELFTNSEIPTFPNTESGFDIQKVKETFNLFRLNEINLNIVQLKYLYQNSSNINKIIEALEKIDNDELIDDSTFRSISRELVDKNLTNIKFLKLYFEENCKFMDFVFNEDTISPNNISKFISYDKINNFISDLENYLTEKNSGILRKFLNSNLEKLKNKILLDYPELNNNFENIEMIIVEAKKTKEQVESIKQQYPFLKYSYIFNPVEDLQSLKHEFQKLTHISNSEIIDYLKQKFNCSASELTLGNTDSELQRLKKDILNFNNQFIIQKPLEIFGFSIKDKSKLYKIFSNFSSITNQNNSLKIAYLIEFLETYKILIESKGFSTENISSLLITLENINLAKFQDYLNLHSELSKNSLKFFNFENVDRYEEKVLKILESKNITRFSNLKEHTAEIQRIVNSFENKKRLTKNQAEILFKNITCIISPADLVSEYFPMEEGLIDWVIIDEASQVSIAESLSIMLRSNQSIIFGDELQYGAVGAVTVSEDYSKQYFKDILNGFVKDREETILTEDMERISTEVSKNLSEDEFVVPTSEFYKFNPGTKEWLKTFSIRTSTLTFAKALANYSDSLVTHFRSFPEIIDYSKEHFYKPSEINLITSRIRTRPISEVLKFVKVETKGLTSQNVNLDEIDAVAKELTELYNSKFKGSIGIICSFREQSQRMEEKLREDLDFYPKLQSENNLKIWFIGDVQGEERDVIIYSFVEDKKIQNGSLGTIYPIIGGIADNIRNLKMQRLNVGFSRAKDKMIFVHSMELNQYNDTRLGNALNFYKNILNDTNDIFIDDIGVFGSPAEERLYSLITQTEFFNKHKDNLKLIAQFEIGKYIKEEFNKSIPKYRVDFLLNYKKDSKEIPLIIEYDGIEFHTKDLNAVYSAETFDREYLDYDIQRQLELESYGYKFLRINKFNLIPRNKEQTEVDVLNEMLYKKFKI